jgi:hypothetical protein
LRTDGVVSERLTNGRCPVARRVRAVGLAGGIIRPKIGLSGLYRVRWRKK